MSQVEAIKRYIEPDRTLGYQHVQDANFATRPRLCKIPDSTIAVRGRRPNDPIALQESEKAIHFAAILTTGDQFQYDIAWKGEELALYGFEPRDGRGIAS